MSQILGLVLVGMGFFTSSSVSFVERTDAMWTNPAGLALHGESVEVKSGFAIADGGWNIGLGLGASGLGYRSGDSTGIWTTGLALPIGSKFRIGGAYSWGESKFWGFGIQANPWNFLAAGAAIQTGPSPLISGGLGFRPFTDRVTVYADLVYQEGIDHLRTGVGIEPLSGILLGGTYIQPFATEENPAFEGSAEISFNYIKIGAVYRHRAPWSDPEQNLGINFGLSFPRYPGIKLKKPGPKVIEWVPKGRPEGPAPSGFKLGAISIGVSKSKTFYDLLTELRDLGERKDIEGLMLDFRGASYFQYQAEEIRAELEALKESGIKMIAFSEGYSMGSYYLASVADRIYMVPTGEIVLVSGYARTLHIKGTLDKLGIEPQFFRVGEYKAAYEMFEFSETSDEDKEQLTAVLESFYDEMFGAIERNRGISRAEFEKIMNERIFVTGDTAVALGLVDGLCQALELDSIIEEEFGKKVDRITLKKLNKEPDEIPRAWVDEEDNGMELPGLGKIAIVVAEGSIVTGESGSNPVPIPLIGGKYMGSTTISEILNEVKDNKQIKAVVFRINSGGGSALASEIMNRALTELAAEKPVIVSMAGAAASGGYYIAAPGDKIYADATTVTGSIGILGGKFVTKGFYDKLGINRETVKLYPHSDIFSPDRPFDDEEANLMQQMMDQGYAEFVNRVAEGRDMTYGEVDGVARGRIWSGVDGVRTGLVDNIGGIMDAVEEARKMADLGPECGVLIYPKPKAAFDLDEDLEITEVISLDMLPSWIEENFLFMVPFQIEMKLD